MPSLNRAFLVFFTLMLLWEHPFSQTFGKNKINFKKIKWKVLKTPNFDIYYDQDQPEIAKRAAEIAEKCAVELSGQYRHELTSTIPIVIFPSALDFFNNHILPMLLPETTGGFTEIFRNRVVIPYNGKWDEFNHVLRHELSHAYQFNIIYSKDKINISKIAKRMPPLWVMEGISEHFSIGDEETAKLYERDGILTGLLPSLKMMENPAELGPAFYYVYKGGQSFFNWLSRQYGGKKVADFFFSVAFHGGSEDAAMDVFNLSLAELSRNWHRDLKKKYWPQIQKLEPPDTRAKRITTHFRDKSTFNLKPALGRNGRYLYFFSNKKIYTQIVKYDRKRDKIVDIIASEEQDNFYESLGFLHHSLSMDQEKELLHFVSRRGNRFFFNVYDLSKNRIRKRRSIKFSSVYASALSPDGGTVAFVGSKGGPVDLYLFDLKSKKLTQLTHDAYREGGISWSPDGEKIIYSSNKSSGVYQTSRNLFVLDLVKDTEELFSPSEGINEYPAWSPDGKRIAFISDRQGVADLYIKDLETRLLSKYTQVIGAINHPSWGEKNMEIAYTAFNEGGYDVFIHPLDFSRENKKDKDIITSQLEVTDLQREKTEATSSSLTVDDLNQARWLQVASNGILYQPKILPDVFQGSLGASSSGGIGGRFIMSGSDMLGHYQLELDTFLSYNFRYKIFDTDTLLSVVNLQNRVHFGFSAEAFQFTFFDLESLADDFVNLNSLMDINRFREKRLGVSAIGRYALDKYNRFDFDTSIRFHQREFLNVDDDFFENPRYENLQEFKAVAYPARLAFVHDSTLQGFLHPVDNRRTVLEVEGAPPIHSGSLAYFKFFADIRAYAMVVRWASFAMRFMGGYVTGPSENEFRFQIGGGAIHSNYPYIRGFPIGQFFGTKMYLFNLEYRSVLLDFAQFSFPFKWRLRNISGVLFWDMGSAFDDFKEYKPWDEKRLQDLKMSFGFGLRFVFFFFPLKFDFATPFTGRSIAKFRNWDFFFSLGFDF